MEMLNAAGVMNCAVAAYVDFDLMVESTSVLVSV
jgi:hypothetical protein